MINPPLKIATTAENAASTDPSGNILMGFGPGQTPIPGAPTVRLSNGVSCIPQHFTEFAHTRDSVEDILADIEFDKDFLAFVGEDAGGVFIQIGIVGYDNYRPMGTQRGRKIVYGRRWRVEQNLPTSEIIQTVFLAFKKAREHEIRERFSLSWNGKRTTPFNNHHDLPLMSENADLLTSGVSNDDDVYTIIPKINFGDCKFQISSIKCHRPGLWLVDLDVLSGTNKAQPGIPLEGQITVLTSSLSASRFLHELVSVLIDQSDRYVDEAFTYRGFARFSRSVNTLAISDLSATTRAASSRASNTPVEFQTQFQHSRYETDTTRVPTLTDSSYSKALRSALDEHNIKEGILPTDAEE